MNYEIVTLEEKTVVGFSARTNNNSPQMGEVIGGLWRKFYSPNGYNKIENKANEKAVGIYTDYDNDEKSDYTVITACEVSSVNSLENGLEVHKIPSGKYAKFVVCGNMITAVAEFWQKLWGMELNRSFVCDFEEYQNADPENAVIHIYIGLKEN